ncbi:hypothetical protein DAPPUDRAFT_266283 [Daphnia pulex]|uniref:Uncharacterized protein n=1 Tax=Daphnia pulex TaxID=6669 RepID=E9HUT1_DAPPU|nr:hypothetical protein DAPPUDRAFT_266283 [Daphnia pulex]|eukprot:EFX64502.1 hypothetical protein DAPPUDRAFT_266283 [Daphnia pulex]
MFKIPPPAEENPMLACTKPFHLEIMIEFDNWRIPKQTWIALIALVAILPLMLADR